MRYASQLMLVALSATLLACSPRSGEAQSHASAAATDAAARPASPTLKPAPAGKGAGAVQHARLELSGLGALKIGDAPPAGGAWVAAGAHGDAECSALRSADYPGVYALVEDGKVRRITAGAGSNVKLIEGVGVGAPEADVRRLFPGFRSEPHKYEDAPAKYLTAPNASVEEPALRFEIGGDGTVTWMHVGQMPQLAYVEGCG